ncbi:addiction module toxin, RelE/StbE family [Dyadobacter fermentans DSM 18053]|uniref:Addiction module toxin, RelE/StbE family n=1 Tax=Dyadobacter fermentans (strain ATCC 700827 / DSM 18053 / CIP 107007 / KCTC 52180 / NS114) TaxID=471854 RepID=C6VXQ6_DYAFD|nr:addiction module toxin, RelE/StbE family [Dyadobacter fermentans DSM 18053]
MVYEIKWSPLAKKDYTDIISYLYDVGGDRSAEKFTDSLQASLERLERYPYIGTADEIIPSMRKLLLYKRYRLAYTVFENTVLVMNITHSSQRR